MPIDNPYAAPASDLAARGLTLPSRPGRPALWALAFALNTIMPGLLATAVLAPAGWAGVVAASVLLLALGLGILSLFPAWTRRATAGAFLMAATQVCPFIQMFAGLLAIEVTSELLGIRSVLYDQDAFAELPQSLGPTPAFVATLLLGLALLGGSVVLGIIARAIRDAWANRQLRTFLESRR